MKFDELNQLKRFFATMEISDGAKKKRAAFAYLLYDAVIYTLTLIKVERDIQNRSQNDTERLKTPRTDSDLTSYKPILENRLYDVFESENIPYEDDYIPQLVNEIIDTTSRHPDEEYYTSQDRALLIAQNEANTAYNHVDYISAKESGKRYKVWLTENDDRVRPAHEDVDALRIPIDEYFYVGNDTMRYPHDYLNGSPENLINCRCVCTYE